MDAVQILESVDLNKLKSGAACNRTFELDFLVILYLLPDTCVDEEIISLLPK
jgi:hypothetical protein